MEFELFKTKIKIEFPFILVLCFTALFDIQDMFFLLLYSSLHEIGHLVALLLCGGKAEMIFLSYFGVGLKYQQNLSKVKDTVVILAGLITSLILYFVTENIINLMLFFINSLPIYPLDGGRLLQLFCYNLSRVISAIFLLGIIVFALYLLIVYKSFSMIFIALYLIIYSLSY